MKKMRAFVLALTLAVALAGCGSEKMQPQGQTETPDPNNEPLPHQTNGQKETNNPYREEDTILIEPPVLTVANDQTSVEAWKGTYSWRYQNADGTAAGVEADGMHPLHAKEYMAPLPLSLSTLDPMDRLVAPLQFDIAPDKVSVRCWSDVHWGDPNAESEAIEVLIAEPEPVSGYSGAPAPSYSLRLKEGNYIYEVVAEWNRAVRYNGTAYYGFYTVLNTPAIAEQLPLKRDEDWSRLSRRRLFFCPRWNENTVL